MNFRIKELDKNYDGFELYKLFKDYKDSVFLDSSKKESSFSEYSFIGINPVVSFKSERKKVYINDKEINSQDPFAELEELIIKYKIQYDSELPLVAGLIGYFSYDAGRQTEKFKDTAIEDVCIPEIYFNIYENLIIMDLKRKKTFISALGLIENSIEKIEERLKEYKPKKTEVLIEDNNTKFYTNFEKNEYENVIQRMKEYIIEGDMYIANMTRRIWCYNSEESFKIYERLRAINKAPFSAYLNYEDFQVISSSPERFISVKNRVVHTRPIKGTRPRGRSKKEDDANKKELLNSDKDRSELLMIVDLERNDLSKVCKPHSVKVTELFKIEEYATVFHLVSTIQGELEDNVSAVKCMKECFPGGSITGAPKIRAMEIIEELENLKRNLYTGSIGYFDLRGNCDFNIVIRTIIKKQNKAYFGVGGGITIESQNEAEWFETIDKADALMRVL